MDTVLSQKELEEMLDAAVQEITEKITGIHLYRNDISPGQALGTVHITFKKGFQSSLTLCADPAMLLRMAQSALQQETVTQQDLEDFTKEYFNVLCGRIAAALYRRTKIAARFSVPAFYWGRFAPEGQRAQFALNYSSEQLEGVQLTHHVPDIT